MGQNRILRTVTNNRQANLTASIAMENIKKMKIGYERKEAE